MSSSDSDDGGEVQTELIDTDDDSPAVSEDESLSEIVLGPVALNDIRKGTYVLVEFQTGKSLKPKYYVAKV